MASRWSARADGEAAYDPHVVEVGDLEVAFLAADGVQREGASDVWSAGTGSVGTASARGSNAAGLVAAVEAASARDQLVVVYVHWGREYQSCPTQSQRLLARDLADAGADVVVGSHSHVLGGGGWAGDAVVAYGLGNFVWYHARQSRTGVLRSRSTPGEPSGSRGRRPGSRRPTGGRSRSREPRAAAPWPTGAPDSAAPDWPPTAAARRPTTRRTARR